MMSRKERKEENLRKRDLFYSNIKNVSFDFNVDKLDLTTFISAFLNELKKLINQCIIAVAKCKGSVTRKYLQLIINVAETLMDNIEKIVNSNEGYIDISSFEASLKNVLNLSKVLLKTSKAHFPSLINPSRLDYDPTRNIFKRLSEELNSCHTIFGALKNEHAADILLKYLQYSPNHDKFIGEGKLKLDTTFYFYRKMGKDIVRSLARDLVDEWFLRRIINSLKEFGKIKNFSKQIKNLEGLLKELTDNGKGANATCAHCRKSFTNQDVSIWEHMNNGCHHVLCIDCLKSISAKRGYMAYRCPLCKKRLNKEWVLKRIAGEN